LVISIGLEFYIMGATEKRRDLTPHKTALLAVMGVQMWYQRPSAGSNDTSDDPGTQVPDRTATVAQRETPDIEVGPVVEPIAFSWVRSATGMVATSLDVDRTVVGLLNDILVFGDWARGNEITKAVQGDFRWPQLLDSGGTPARALAVFVDKHLTSKAAWLALTSEVAPSVAPWLEDVGVEVIVVPELRGRIGDAAIKKSIWQRLKPSG